ncbi:MAG: protein kinase domain-containing protein [Planctomycetota bacterium]
MADGPDSTDDDADAAHPHRAHPDAAQPDPSTLLPRPVDGPFELLREIGSGSSGTVYEAVLTRPYRELDAGMPVAVKFLRPELLADRKAQERLFAEGELGMSIRHPNVAEIHGVETVEMLGVATTYLVMQYVQGTTLRELLQRNGAALEDLTRRLGADAARGLFALHRRGLVHRDVKPENLILTPGSELKIVDLGLVRPFGAEGGGSSPGHSSASSSGFGLAGSVAYASPESLRGAPAGPRSDLYALGVVLYEVTTGQHPFADATTPDEMMHAHLYRLPPLPSHLRPRISPLLEQVLLDLLQKAPDDRPRSASELARVLEQGERSDYWQRHEADAPVLASSRRLMRMRRPAEAPFVDRKLESAQLDHAFAAARSGRGAVLAVVAPESTGRRRLLDEAMERWLDGDQPPRYLGGDADSGFGHGEPFASTLLDLLLRGDDRHTPNARPRAVDRARQRFALNEPDAEALVAVAFGDSTEPSEVRANRLANAFLALPKKGQPLVVRVDHADDLDTSGTLVLQQLAAAAPSTWLLVLLAAGPDTTLVDAEQRLELQGLDERSFLQFGRSLFRTPIEQGVDDYLRGAHQILSGLPGSLLEALEHLVDQGDLQGRVGDYHGLGRDVEPAPAPRHVQRFRERVQSLLPAHRAVLSAAAVLGDRCSLAELAALILQPELAVLETLSLFRGRIVRSQGGEVSFRHRDFRQALLRSLPNEEQQRLHAAAAQVLEARGASPLVVGMHRSQALDHEGCLLPLLEALDNRVRAGSRRTALRLVGRLAVHFRHVATTDRIERLRLRFLVLSAQAQQNADQSQTAARTFRDAEKLARQLHDLDASAAARIGLATDALDHGRMLSAITLLETVHDDLDDEHTATGPATDALAAQAHALHGRILLYLGQAADCMKHLLAAKKRVPPEEDDLRCHLWIDLARAEGLARRFATALRTLHAIEKAHPVRHLPRARLRFHLYRGQLRAVLGDPEAGQDLRLAFEEASQLALPVYAARAALFRGERQFFRGRDDESRQRFDEALAMARAAGDRVGEASARCQLLRLGATDDGLPALIDELDLPELHANLLLAMAGSDRAHPDTEARLDALLDNADLPLAVHLRALAWLDRPASARSLVRSISERFPQRTLKQRFLQLWNDKVRI